MELMPEQPMTMVLRRCQSKTKASGFRKCPSYAHAGGRKNARVGDGRRSMLDNRESGALPLMLEEIAGPSIHGLAARISGESRMRYSTRSGRNSANLWSSWGVSAALRQGRHFCRRRQLSY